MVINVRCSKAVGDAILRLFAAIETIAPNYTPEDLQFEMNPDEQAGIARVGPAKTRYKAILPTLPDGTFDMAEVQKTVEANLSSLGASTITGIVYKDIVDGTLRGDIVTERAIRDARMMKGGSSQRAIVQLRANGLVVGEAIDYTQGGR